MSHVSGLVMVWLDTVGLVIHVIVGQFLQLHCTSTMTRNRGNRPESSRAPPRVPWWYFVGKVFHVANVAKSAHPTLTVLLLSLNVAAAALISRWDILFVTLPAIWYNTICDSSKHQEIPDRRYRPALTISECFKALTRRHYCKVRQCPRCVLWEKGRTEKAVCRFRQSATLYFPK